MVIGKVSKTIYAMRRIPVLKLVICILPIAEMTSSHYYYRLSRYFPMEKGKTEVFICLLQKKKADNFLVLF